ncbi:MAG TPA: ribonuclease HII [Dehalococcoidia bacterium]|nr:ribonuclease HII [Dehalococcoidia bacterium]
MEVAKPGFSEEQSLLRQGYRLIAGVDEVGRGALAGPVTAAAVILPHPCPFPWAELVRDSKLLTPSQRQGLARHIEAQATAVSVAMVEADYIDKVGIARASLEAMQRAVAGLNPTPQYLLIDYLKLPQMGLPQKGLRDGDSLCFSIACASIMAKVARDQRMTELDRLYPGYGLASHKGYGTAQHLACLRRLGPCPVHRRSFAPVREVLTPLKLGAHGERLATEYLRQRGFSIRETNFRSPEGEIDIVAQKGELVVFVEVRTRQSKAFGTPEESITRAKKARLVASAQAYIQSHPDLPPACRIDVLAIDMRRGRPARIELIENAVQL